MTTAAPATRNPKPVAPKPATTFDKMVADAKAKLAKAKQDMLKDAANRITDTAKRSLENRFVLVKPKCSIPSNSRTNKRVAERSAQAGGPVVSATRASVKIFDDAVLAELRDLNAEMNDYLNDVGFKAPGGMFIVHATRTLELAQKGQDFQKRYRKAADDFLQRYEKACEDWKDNLGEDAAETKYHDTEKIRTRLGMGANAERYGFRLDVTPIGDFAQKYQLDASQGELDYLQQTMRSQFDAVVASGLKDLHTALDELAQSNTPGKRVRQTKLDSVKRTARKLRENDLLTADTEAIVAKVEKAVSADLPKKKKDRDGYIGNVASVASDLSNLLGALDDTGE